AAIKATLIGLQESPVGFSGVWPADQAAMLPDNMIQEPVDLETLMIAFGKGGHPHG
ncbi:ABC transporter ATP-binding protein, partial [Streptococcus thermophilus]|nr:ABC transporter ATP-binding protein [Streptococcus thermophilus]